MEAGRTTKVTATFVWLMLGLGITAAVGEPLPELAHTRAITRLFGVGEMPAGTLAGKLHRIPFEVIDKPGYRYPEGYRKDDHSWVKEIVDAGHAEGLRVVIYDGAFRNLDPLLMDHPEWRQKNRHGQPTRFGFGSWHSPYRQAYIDRWVKVAQESGLDGIMVDMLFTCPQGGDYSDYTVKAFRDRFGVEPPPIPRPTPASATRSCRSATSAWPCGESSSRRRSCPAARRSRSLLATA